MSVASQGCASRIQEALKGIDYLSSGKITLYMSKASRVRAQRIQDAQSGLQCLSVVRRYFT